MASPIENRPLPARKNAAVKRKISRRERKRQLFQYWVTVFLAVVFIGTSVGVLILARPMGHGQTTSMADQAQQRLAGVREQAQKEPNNPQWPYESAHIFFEQGDMDQAATQYVAALKIDPAYLPALQELANVYLTQGKAKEAQKLLKTGIDAEKKDIAKANKDRKPDTPELYPDPRIRELLFDADMALGSKFAGDAGAVARELLTMNPTDFMHFLQGWALQNTLEKNKKDTALSGLEIVLGQAKRLKDKDSADQAGKLMSLVVQLSKRPPPGLAPSGAAAPKANAAPATGASGAPAAAASGAPAANASGAPVAGAEAPAANASGAPAAVPVASPNAAVPTTTP